MPHVYTGTLTDIGLGVLTGRYPVMRVRPEREAFGPDGLVSAVPEEVAVDEDTGAFSMSLYASTELVPQVSYVIEVGRFEQGFDGPRFVGQDTWKFLAPVGGGAISELEGLRLGNDLVWSSASAVDPTKRTGFQLDTVTGDLYQWKA